MQGRRLHGEFALVRFTGKRKEWLLLKKKIPTDASWKLERALTPSRRKVLTQQVPRCKTS
ncbi:MAG: hypothetical protein ACXWYD_18345 [Candidatus Binatia bacterium]